MRQLPNLERGLWTDEQHTVAEDLPKFSGLSFFLILAFDDYYLFPRSWLKLEAQRRQCHYESIQSIEVERLAILARGKADIKSRENCRKGHSESEKCKILSRTRVGAWD